MPDLISRKAAINKYCLQTCGCKREECGLTYERDGTECCSVVEFLENVPSYNCEKCFLWEEDEDE